MRTTVDIDPVLLRRLRDGAHREGVSFKEHLNRVLRRGIDSPPPELPPYRCPVFSLGPPLRPIEKALAVADALELEERARKLDQRR